jgi:hypothetical protein
MAVWIGYLKAAQSIVRILERLSKSRAAAGELDGKCIGIRYIKIRVPPGPGIALRIWKRIATPLEEDHPTVPADDCKERVLIRRGWLLKHHFESKFVSIEGDGPMHAIDDKER